MSDDTHVALKEFIERILNEREKLFEQKILALEKATELALKNVDVRMSHLNELRQDYSHFITIDKYDLQHEAMRKQVEALVKNQARWIGFAAAISFVSGIIGGIIVKLFGL